jgi:hypothetical protein
MDFIAGRDLRLSPGDKPSTIPCTIHFRVETLRTGCAGFIVSLWSVFSVGNEKTDQRENCLSANPVRHQKANYKD